MGEEWEFGFGGSLVPRWRFDGMDVSCIAGLLGVGIGFQVLAVAESSET